MLHSSAVKPARESEIAQLAEAVAPHLQPLIARVRERFRARTAPAG